MKMAMAISILLMPALAFASTINSSKAVGIGYVVGLAACVIIGYVVFEQRRVRRNYRRQAINPKLGPIVRFEPSFILYLRGDNGKYYLPDITDKLMLANVKQSNLHEIVRQCFIKTPELFLHEKEAGRMFRSEARITQTDRGVLPFKMRLCFAFNYRPEINESSGEMISLMKFEDGDSFKTSDIISLKKSVVSTLKQKPELIASEIKAGRLAMVTPVEN